MSHALGAGWRWEISIGGHDLHLDAVLTTIMAAGVLIAGVLIAARRASRGQHGYVVGLAALSLAEIDRTVSAGRAGPDAGSPASDSHSSGSCSPRTGSI